MDLELVVRPAESAQRRVEYCGPAGWVIAQHDLDPAVGGGRSPGSRPIWAGGQGPAEQLEQPLEQYVIQRAEAGQRDAATTCVELAPGRLEFGPFGSCPLGALCLDLGDVPDPGGPAEALDPAGRAEQR